MKKFPSLIFAWMIVLYSSAGVLAHGGGDLIIRSQEIGPYRISVWVNPPDPRVDKPVHYTVGLASPKDNSPILDANVFIKMQALSDNAIAYTASATTDQSINKLYYEADLDVDRAGVFKTIFTIKGPAGEGEVAIETVVKEQSRINWLIWGFAGLALVLIFGVWRSQSAKREKSEN